MREINMEVQCDMCGTTLHAFSARVDTYTAFEIPEVIDLLYGFDWVTTLGQDLCPECVTVPPSVRRAQLDAAIQEAAEEER